MCDTVHIRRCNVKSHVEKFKVAILHLNKEGNHCFYQEGDRLLVGVVWGGGNFFSRDQRGGSKFFQRLKDGGCSQWTACFTKGMQNYTFFTFNSTCFPLGLYTNGQVLTCNTINRRCQTRQPHTHICNLWALWPVIQLINHLLSDFEKIVYWLNYRPLCPKVADFCYFCMIAIRYP